MSVVTSIRDHLVSKKAARQNEAATEQQRCTKAMAAKVRGKKHTADHIATYAEKQPDPVAFYDELEAKCEADLKAEQTRDQISQLEPQMAEAWVEVRSHSAATDIANGGTELMKALHAAKARVSECNPAIEDYRTLRKIEGEVQGHHDSYKVSYATVNKLTKEIDALKETLKPPPKPRVRREAFYVDGDGKEVIVEGSPDIAAAATGRSIQYRLV